MFFDLHEYKNQVRLHFDSQPGTIVFALKRKNIVTEVSGDIEELKNILDNKVPGVFALAEGSQRVGSLNYISKRSRLVGWRGLGEVRRRLRVRRVQGSHCRILEGRGGGTHS